MNEVLGIVLGAIAGALLGSLSTVVLFSGRLVKLETQIESVLEKLGETKAASAKASKDAQNAWNAIRGVEGYVAGQTNEVPKWTPRRDTGEAERA